MKAYEWIDRVKAVTGIESDYGVAKAIGLSRQSISGYRNGKFTFDEESSIKVATVLGERPEAVLLDQIAERTKNPEIRSTLFEVAQKMLGQLPRPILCKVHEGHATKFIAACAHAVWR